MIAQKPLISYRKKVTASDGEDGIVERIFEIIGTENRWCVEFGALNGVKNSNVWNLIANYSWSAVLIEADRTYFDKMVETYRDNPRVFCLNTFVEFEGPNSLDSIFEGTPLPIDLDLLSIDIDGNDYHVFESLVRYKPRVILIEFNQSIPNDVEFVQPRDMRIQQGSSLKSIVGLARLKGYELLTCTDNNAFFVTKELYPKFGISDNSLDVLHPDRSYQTRLFQLYDGTLVLTGCDRLLWSWTGQKIDPEKIQVLPKSKRVYGSHVDSSAFMRNFKYHFRKSFLYQPLQRCRSYLRGIGKPVPASTKNK